MRPACQSVRDIRPFVKIAAMNIRRDDEVLVIAGSDKGTRGRVLRVLPARGKVIVEGVAKVWKHVRKSQKHPHGDRISKEMPIDASNVMLIDPKDGKPTRVGYRYLDDGRKERFAKRSGLSLGVMSPPRPRYAKKSG